MAPLEINISNNALNLIGQGTNIKAFDKSSFESVLCEQLFLDTLNTALDFHNWSFARKDEIITKDYLLGGAISLPYDYTYNLPTDLMRVLFLTPTNATSIVETMAYTNEIQYNFRNYDNKKVLVTNIKYDFVIHYQSFISDLSVISPTFKEALEYMLAGRLAPALIKGEQGIKIGTQLTQFGHTFLNKSISLDSQQGAESIENNSYKSFLLSRR